MLNIKEHVMGKLEASIRLWVEICGKHGIEVEAVEENGVLNIKPVNEEEALNRQFGANGVPADNWYTLAKIEFEKRVKQL